MSVVWSLVLLLVGGFNIISYLHLWCLFFFKQKTAYEVRISDWSSDVCSSHLLQQERHSLRSAAAHPDERHPRRLARRHHTRLRRGGVPRDRRPDRRCARWAEGQWRGRRQSPGGACRARAGKGADRALPDLHGAVGLALPLLRP